MSRTSRIPGFHCLAVEERRRILAEHTGEPLDQLTQILETGGLNGALANRFMENVVGTYSLTLSLVTNIRVNKTDYLVPMAIEEPSVVAAASSAARLVREGGGFQAQADPPLMAAQIQLWDVRDPEHAAANLLAAEHELLAQANEAVSNLVTRGGGAKNLEIRNLGDGLVVVHVWLDVRDAMGANLLNNVAEALGPTIAEVAHGTLGLQILTNLADQRKVRVTARVPVAQLAHQKLTGEEVCARIVRASKFAERDPYRAATHNKGILNGVDGVAIVTGNDWRAVEAGAHAYAARSGRYAPLATWRTEDEYLRGDLEMPLALGTVGGTLRVHPSAQIALKILGINHASELAMVAGSVGLASNLAALRALSTEGIQQGHMALHARSVAQAAGAEGEEIAPVAAEIAEARDVTVAAAVAALMRLRERREGASTR
jgi:hydroxymethylglutaryl-CoA reductase